MTSYTYDNLMSEFRLFFDGDAWGHALHWWFTVADEIYFNRPELEVPADWKFRPSPLGLVNDPDDFATFAVSSATDEALKRFGDVLHRYAARLKRAGCSY